MANPYNLEFLQGLIGQQETQRLEFKSSRDLLQENSQRRFISAQVVPTVSAFLNTDGGLLIIGIEENKDGVAANLSDGIPRSRTSWQQLQSSICGLIQPAVAGYISVFSVKVGESGNGDELLAFVVDVKPGVTAYQADDKKYYVRRSGQSEAMEDKDIRLRMLAADKPRVAIGLDPRIVPGEGIFSRNIQLIAWDLWFQNVGVTNIPQALVQSKLDLQGLSESGCAQIRAWTPEFKKTDFSMEDVKHIGLLPGQRFNNSLIKVFSSVFVGCPNPASVTMTADITVFIDNGLPSELRNYDLMVDLRSIMGAGIDAEWKLPSD